MKDHVLFKIKPKSKDFSAADAVDQCFHWIVNDFTPHNCRLLLGTNQRVTNCTCIGFLQEEGNSAKAMQVGEYLVHYAKLNRETKRELMYEWAKVASVLASVDPGNKTLYI